MDIIPTNNVFIQFSKFYNNEDNSKEGSINI